MSLTMGRGRHHALQGCLLPGHRGVGSKSRKGDAADFPTGSGLLGYVFSLKLWANWYVDTQYLPAD